MNNRSFDIPENDKNTGPYAMSGSSGDLYLNPWPKEIDLTKEEMNVSDEEYAIQKALGSTPTRCETSEEMGIRREREYGTTSFLQYKEII